MAPTVTSSIKIIFLQCQLGGLDRLLSFSIEAIIFTDVQVYMLKI